MITLYAFEDIFEDGRGETKDLRVQWALEETGLPYRVLGIDQTKGELDSAAFRRMNPFRQIPVIDDDGFVVTESAAQVLYIAEKAGKLIPPDMQGRTRVTQWCFAAAATVEPTLMCLDLIDIFGDGKQADVRAKVRELAERWLGGVEERLAGREWIANDDFSAADIVTTGVLRTIRKTDLLEPFPRTKSHYERCIARPAWERTLEAAAKRLGMDVDDIR